MSVPDELVFESWCPPCDQREADEQKASALAAIRGGERCFACWTPLVLETWCVCGGRAICRECHESLKSVFQHRCKPPAGTLVRRPK